MKKIDLSALPVVTGTGYPPPHDKPCQGRMRQRLGEAGDLTQFGVNRLTLPPGAWSSQRHWHTHEDEFVWVVQGEVVLEVGGRDMARDACDYPDIDMIARPGEDFYRRRDGTAYGDV